MERGIARPGYEVFDAEGKEKLGTVTSGTLSPTLGYPIGIAYVKKGYDKVGTKLNVRIRDRFFPAEIIFAKFCGFACELSVS